MSLIRLILSEIGLIPITDTIALTKYLNLLVNKARTSQSLAAIH